jgi:hypothetical protein
MASYCIYCKCCECLYNLYDGIAAPYTSTGTAAATTNATLSAYMG